MPKINDPHYLLNEQYKDAANLDARVQLHVRFSTNRYGWNRWYFDQLALPTEAHILELGSGPGYLWRDNLDRIPAEWQVTVSDFSPGMVAQAQRNLATASPLFHFQQVDVQAIPFEDNTFDAVIANHMLYHVPDRLQALSEMQRVLQPDGQAFLATNGQHHLHELHDLMQRFDSTSSFGWGGQTHELFSLDSGHIELELFFHNIQVRRYEDALVVTEVEPLVDYIMSMSSTELAQARRVELFQFIAQELAGSDAIHIAKDSGLFIGFKPPVTNIDPLD